MRRVRVCPRIGVRRVGFGAMVLAASLLAGCTPGGEGAGDGASATPAASPVASVSATTLRVLAGSELADMGPVLEQAAEATGVSVEFAYTGTLDGAEQVASGEAVKSHDATWFSSNRYLSLIPGGNERLVTSERTMSSPVVLGLLPQSASRLGWDKAAPTWAQIAKAAQEGQFTFGMTNPAASNSGFSALVGVSTALAGGGAAIDPARINSVAPQLVGFFSGQRISAGSSKWLADTFIERAGAPVAEAGGADSGGDTTGGTTTGGADSGRVDGLVNYESVLLGMSAQGVAGEPLTLVYPSDGVVSADYPLSLLEGTDAPKREAFDALAGWLRTPEAQNLIQTSTHRRPVVPGVQLSAEFGDRMLIELPFPAQRSAADALISAYNNRLRRPAQMVYTLDVSGSMNAATGGGDGATRLDALKSAFGTLSGSTDSTAEAHLTFNDRERVTIDSFNQSVSRVGRFDIPASGGDEVRTRISSAVGALRAGGNTSVYDALMAAYTEAAAQQKANPQAVTSIVLMTDGERTSGMTFEQFRQAYQALPNAVQAVPTFPIVVGEADQSEMEQVAALTRGKAFDARTVTLTDVFKEIRGYQ